MKCPTEVILNVAYFAKNITALLKMSVFSISSSVFSNVFSIPIGKIAFLGMFLAFQKGI